MNRRISGKAALQLAAALVLVRELELPLARALELAHRIVDSVAGGPSHAGQFVTVAIDMDELRRWVEERLRLAAEMVPPSRRGRPPGRSAYS